MNHPTHAPPNLRTAPTMTPHDATTKGIDGGNGWTAGETATMGNTTQNNATEPVPLR